MGISVVVMSATLSHFGAVSLDAFLLKLPHFSSATFDASAIAGDAQALVTVDASHEKVPAVAVARWAILAATGFLMVRHLMRFTGHAALGASMGAGQARHLFIRRSLLICINHFNLNVAFCPCTGLPNVALSPALCISER